MQYKYRTTERLERQITVWHMNMRLRCREEEEEVESDPRSLSCLLLLLWELICIRLLSWLALKRSVDRPSYYIAIRPVIPWVIHHFLDSYIMYGTMRARLILLEHIVTSTSYHCMHLCTIMRMRRGRGRGRMSHPRSSRNIQSIGLSYPTWVRLSELERESFVEFSFIASWAKSELGWLKGRLNC